jgi:hypothetical protein
MNLIDAYVSEIGRHLPTKTRTDIEAEIRSALEDMLEERSQKAGRPADDEMIYEILKEYGDPEKVAASYLPERYLIGPTVFPIFLALVKVILVILSIIALVGLGIDLGQSASNIQTGLQIVGKALGNLFTSILTSIASLVFILGIIEWALRDSGERINVKGLPRKKDWDPHLLNKISPPNRIKLGDTIAEIVFTFFAIFLFNFYPQIFSLGYSTSGNWYIGTGNWTSVPILSEAFFHYVPYLTVVWILTIVLDILLLRQGYWNTLTHIFSIVLRVINISIAAAMLAGPSLIALAPNSLPANVIDPDTLRLLANLLSKIFPIGLWLSILGNSVEIIRMIYRMIANKIPVLEVQGKKQD